MGYKDIICGIYCIKNLVNDKKYIGQSVNIKARWRQHKSALRHGKHDNEYLQKAWNKHGEENFVFEIIEQCSEQDLDDRERYYIKKYNTLDENYGYNLKDGGQDHPTVKAEVVAKQSENLKKSYADHPQLREARREKALEMWAQPGFKEKHSGKNNFMYGKTHTAEARAKISAAHKGKPNWRRDHRPVKCIQLNKIYPDVTEAGKDLGFDGSTILQVCYGNRKICQGYHWEFANKADREKYQNKE